MPACKFPQCPQPGTDFNRDGQRVCRHHKPVVITGSWVPDRHATTSGGEH